ncbi:sugar transferase [Sulfitobacter sp. S0837]|uniref:sugar transferase n=1 Tax=Sulfitobacter maritimus TaxID=2741719 RepID=UPI001583FD09|nr:sugar transferase [Sulfitobacter maritimus]NUH65507.1 sugar transferase [Sulfitobacter maritimus]
MCALLVQDASSLPAGSQYIFDEGSTGYASLVDGRTSYQKVAKRSFDIVFILAALPLLIPLFLLISIAIKIESKGSVFYAQRRTGYLGAPFFMFKFRSMQEDADALRASLSHLNEVTWPEFKLTRDPRITRVGQFLRTTSLDEFPQLFNVLRGEMSLVGPRACSARPEDYKPWQLSRLSVTPGIAGPAQLSGRHAPFDEKCRQELDYIARYSLTADIKLLVKLTVKLLTAPDGK